MFVAKILQSEFKNKHFSELVGIYVNICTEVLVNAINFLEFAKNTVKVEVLTRLGRIEEAKSLKILKLLLLTSILFSQLIFFIGVSHEPS